MFRRYSCLQLLSQQIVLYPSSRLLVVLRTSLVLSSIFNPFLLLLLLFVFSTVSSRTVVVIRFPLTICPILFRALLRTVYTSVMFSVSLLEPLYCSNKVLTLRMSYSKKRIISTSLLPNNQCYASTNALFHNLFLSSGFIVCKVVPS